MAVSTILLPLSILVCGAVLDALEQTLTRSQLGLVVLAVAMYAPTMASRLSCA